MTKNETKKLIGVILAAVFLVAAIFTIMVLAVDASSMKKEIGDLNKQISQLSEVQNTNEAESVEANEMLEGIDSKYVRYSLYAKNDYIIDEGNFHYVIWSENVKVDPNNMDYDKQRTYSIENSENCGYILLSGMEDTPILIKLVPEG